MDMPVLQELDARKKLLAKKLEYLCADFPVRALRVVLEDGHEVCIGSFPEPEVPPKVRTRRPRPDRGKLRTLLTRYLENLDDLDEHRALILRPLDFPDCDVELFTRLKQSICTTAQHFHGPGKVSAKLVKAEHFEDWQIKVWRLPQRM